MGVVKLSTAGILDYQKYSSFLAGNASYSPGSYDLIQSEILTGSQASVTFDVTGLGSTYQHLQLRIAAKSTDPTNDMDNLIVRFNSDSAGNYSHHRLFGNGSSVVSYAGTSTTYCFAGMTTRGSGSTFAAAVLDILDPFETTKYTTTRSLTGGTNSSQNAIVLQSGNWRNTAALTAITLDQGGGGNFVSGSSFTLIGVK